MSLVTRSIALTLTAAASITAAETATAQSWSSSHPDMPSWSIDYAATVAEQGDENQVFVMGGLSGLSALDDVWRFHRTLGWTVLADMPGARVGADSATVDMGGSDTVFLFGGRYGLNQGTTTCWSYDPATDTWDTATPAPMPTARHTHEAVSAPDGRIYVFGGRNSTGTLTTLEIYDPIANTWTTGPSMPRARFGFAALTDCDGFIYLYGGEIGATIHGEVDCFDTNTGSWIAGNPHVGGLPPIPNMPTPRVSLAGALGRNGRHYLMSGNVFGPVPVPDVEAYDPYSNTWSFEPPMLQSRNHFEAVGMGSRVWVMGGYRKIHPTTKKVESYGGLGLIGPCIDDVPTLPMLELGAHMSIATPMDSTGGIIDHIVAPGQSAWLEIRLPSGQQGVIAPQTLDPTQRLQAFAYDAVGNLVGESILGDALLLRGQGGQPGQMSRFFVELRNPSSSEVEFSVFGSDTMELQPIGEAYCTPAVPNSSGDPSGITAEGLTMTSANTFRLSVASLPQQSYGYFLVSRTAATIAHPGGSAGILCLGGNIGRFAGNVLGSGDTGTVSLDVDLTNLPGNPATSVQPGDTWNFTYWHRDFGPNGLTSNFSDAVRVTFE